MKLVKQTILFIADILETITFIGSIYIVIYLFLFFPSAVHGASMEPTFHTGDRIIINRIEYKINDFKRGDIVVLQSPKNPDIDYVKRAIGLSEEIILFKDGKVYINGKLLDESYIHSETNLWDNGFVKNNIPITIPKGYIFVMGDNRNRSSDSREFGPIPISSIVGKAQLLYYPRLDFSL